MEPAQGYPAAGYQQQFPSQQYGYQQYTPEQWIQYQQQQAQWQQYYAAQAGNTPQPPDTSNANNSNNNNTTSSSTTTSSVTTTTPSTNPLPSSTSATPSNSSAPTPASTPAATPDSGTSAQATNPYYTAATQNYGNSAWTMQQIQDYYAAMYQQQAATATANPYHPPSAVPPSQPDSIKPGATSSLPQPPPPPQAWQNNAAAQYMEAQNIFKKVETVNGAQGNRSYADALRGMPQQPQLHPQHHQQQHHQQQQQHHHQQQHHQQQQQHQQPQQFFPPPSLQQQQDNSNSEREKERRKEEADKEDDDERGRQKKSRWGGKKEGPSTIEFPPIQRPGIPPFALTGRPSKGPPPNPFLSSGPVNPLNPLNPLNQNHVPSFVAAAPTPFHQQQQQPTTFNPYHQQQQQQSHNPLNNPQNNPFNNPSFSVTPSARLSGALTSPSQAPPIQPPPASAPPPSAAKQLPQWPEGLIAYVERCLRDAGDNKSSTEAFLKTKIEDAIRNTANQLHKIDWANEPMPPREGGDDAWKSRKKRKDTDDDDDTTTMIMAGGKSLRKTVTKTKKGQQQQQQQQQQQGKLAKKVVAEMVTYEEVGKRTGRAQRFHEHLGNIQDDDNGGGNIDAFEKMKERAYGAQFVGVVGSLLQKASEIDVTDLQITGTCEVLEKRYLRLTSAPDPSTVRPLRVMQKTLALLRSKWEAERDYKYICDQFKSLRQDLTIQHIRDKFTVEVYETHALWALEVGDLSEYNQCQTQLIQLYETPEHRKNYHEFVCYRLLYYLVTSNQTALVNMMGKLSLADRKQPAVSYVISGIRSALLNNNYVSFFKIWNKAPFKAQFLTASLLPHMRYRALEIIARSYKPTKFPLDELQQLLQFETRGELLTFVEKRGAILTPDGQFLDTKASEIHKPDEVEEVEEQLGKAKETGVTHGAFMYT